MLSTAQVYLSQTGNCPWLHSVSCWKWSIPWAQSDRGREFLRQIFTPEKYLEPHGELGVGNEYQMLSRHWRVSPSKKSCAS